MIRQTISIAWLCTALSGGTTTQPASQPARLIQPHDLVWVMVRDVVAPAKDVELLVRVDPEGRVSLLRIGQVELAGLTVAEATGRIHATYSEANVLARPAVMVELAEAAERAKVKPGPIAAGDRLVIRIWNLEKPTMETRVELTVDRNGVVVLPRGGTIELAGLSEFAAETTIAENYRERMELGGLLVSVLRVQSDPPAAMGSRDSP